MELISAFLEDYRGKFNVYQEASRLCAKTCESALEQGRSVRSSPAAAGAGDAAGCFMARRITFETVIREMIRELGLDHPRRMIVPTPATPGRLGLFSKRTLSFLEAIRQIRNRLVHGFEVPGKEGSLREAGRYIEHILKRLCAEVPERVRKIIDAGLDAVPSPAASSRSDPGCAPAVFKKKKPGCWPGLLFVVAAQGLEPRTLRI